MYTRIRFSLTLAAFLFGVATVFGRPALKGVLPVTQPDGTTISLQLVGDEYCHYHTTADGYALKKNSQGYYVYATLDADGQLSPTDIVAHDAGARTDAELQFIAANGQLRPAISPSMLQARSQNAAARSATRTARRISNYDYANFRGLVILVEFNDCSFRYDDYHDIMQQMINQDNYTGESRTNFQLPNMFGGGYYTCTGSMRDFFRDNSMEQFVPTFDVVGPVSINRSQFYPGHDNGTTRRNVQMLVDACTAADELVNFKDYDVDNNGVVDMIYFIFAGLPSYIQGNDERLLWPHQYDISYMQSVRKDGVKLGRYACSTELFGYQDYNWSILEGIGTMCHEFSHVLGLPDFYDTNNYDDRTCMSPGNWSIMANGADYDYGRRPCGYSLFERYALGFTTPQVVTEPGQYTLTNISESNEGVRINSSQDNEYFMLENRQRTKWNAKLPGSGLMVFRVDSTNVSAWQYQNAVNDNPDHPLYELVRATGYHSNDTGADLFPGTSHVTSLDNETSPAHLRSWTGEDTPFGLSDIQEQDSIISFQVFDAFQLQAISLIEQTMLGVGMSQQLLPTFKPSKAQADLTWSSDNTQVATVSADGTVSALSPGIAVITASSGQLSASCTVTVAELPIVPTIADFCQLQPDEGAILQLQDAQVLYVSKKDIYLRDATGAIILNDISLNVEQGDVLTGSIYGKLTQRKEMPLFTAADGLTMTTAINVSPGSQPQPISLHISQLTNHHYAEMVALNKVKLENNGGVWAVHGDQRIRLYNTLGVKNIKVPTDLNCRYDITAIYGTNVLNDQVIHELYLLKSPAATSYTALTGITVNEQVQLPEGRNFPLSAVLTPSTADVFLTWSSDNEQVATVDADGMLTTIAKGNAVITVTDRETGLQAQCLLTVGDRRSTADIAEFTAMSLGSEADLKLTDAQVLYAYKNDAYLRDATGTLRLASTGLTLQTGDVLNGNLYGCFVKNSLVPELRPIEGSTNADNLTITAGTDPEPLAIELAQANSSMLANLITINAAQMVSSPSGHAGIYVVTPDGTEIRLYNSFALKLTMPKNYEGKYYQLTGVLITANVIGETILNLALTKAPVEVEGPTAISSLQALPHPADIYTLSGILIRRQTVSLQGLPSGVYIVEGRKVVIK